MLIRKSPAGWPDQPVSSGCRGYVAYVLHLIDANLSGERVGSSLAASRAWGRPSCGGKGGRRISHRAKNPRHPIMPIRGWQSAQVVGAERFWHFPRERQQKQSLGWGAHLRRNSRPSINRVSDNPSRPAFTGLRGPERLRRGFQLWTHVPATLAIDQPAPKLHRLSRKQKEGHVRARLSAARVH